MKLPHNIKAFIFDMDGLLLDSERQNFETWARTGEEFGFDVAGIHHLLIGRGAKACDEFLLNYFGPQCPVPEMRKRKSTLLKELVEREGVPAKPGAADLLATLLLHNYKCALATSTEKAPAEQRLECAELLQFFEVLCFRDEVALGKPAPDLFLLASKRLEVQPLDCVVLEDSHPGIEAALKANMTAIMIPDLVKPEPWVKDRGVLVLSHLSEVKSLI